MTAAITTVLGTPVVLLSAAVATLYARVRQLGSRYKSIIDAEAEGRRIEADARRNADELKAATAAELDRIHREIEEQIKRRDALLTENTAVAAIMRFLRIDLLF